MVNPLATFPFEAIAIKKYKSPHKNDLSFAKGDRIRVTAFAPKDEDEEEEEDEDDRWLIGETLDGEKTGTFPAGHIEQAASESTSSGKQDEEKSGSGNAVAATAAPVEEPATEQSTIPEPASAESREISENSLPAEREDDIVQEPSIPPTTIPEKKLSSDQASIITPATSEKETPIDSATVEPPKKPTSPPLAPKPSGLAARIAAFNKPQDAPPPIPRGKPGGGWKPPPPAVGAAKPVLPGPSAAQQNRTTNRSSSNIPSTTSNNDSITPESVADSQTSKVNSGFSAADAQTSIKMSLKERMAALQRNEANSTQQEAAAAKPAPKPAPKKIDEERRAAALASMGGASGAVGEEAKVSVEEGGIEDDVESKDVVEEKAEEAQSPAEEKKEETEEAEQETVPLESQMEEKTEEKTEEELESERRAAIAKRMAALGGRRMGGGPGPAMFGAPAPPSKPRQLSTDSRNTNDEVKEEEKDITATANEVPEEKKNDEEESAKPEKMLAVPRRTAPPRRKKSSTSSQPASSPPGAQGPDRKESIEEEKEDVFSPETAAAGAAGVGAAAVGATILGKDDGLLTDEPNATQDTSPPEVIEPEQEDIIRSRRLTEDSIHSSKRTDSFEPSTPVSQSELEEHARQLAAFIRTPEVEANHEELGALSKGEDDEDQEAGEIEEPTIINREILSSPPPPSNAPPRLPIASEDGINRLSSPPPTRAPPIPKTSLPPSQEIEDRTTSPAPTRPPPIPKSSLPPAAELDNNRTTSPAPTRVPPIPTASPVGRRESSLMASIEDIQSGQKDPIQETTLAAPKPRMAMPADESEDEEEEDKIVENEVAEEDPKVDTETTAATAAEPTEMTEEEEERQRRSRLAERMARMGGMPIMGAPMPFRKPPMPAAEREPEPESVIEREDEVQEPQEHEQVEEEQGKNDEDQDEEYSEPIVEPPVTRAGPPPVPTMSPPPPTRSPDMAKTSSQSFIAGGDLTRTNSTRSRPPVPSVSHSRGATSEEIAEMEAAADPTAQQSPPLTRIASPPALPSSPPPRAPSRAPPGAALIAPEMDIPTDQSMMSASNKRLSNASSKVNVASSSSLKGVQASPPSARDIDLMPSSQWWRHGRPVRLPPTLMRPDVGRNVEVQDEGSNHLIRIDLLFEDYSSTAISIKYQDDDANEQYTQIAQRHNFAPMRPNTQELISWSQQIGSKIARQASALLNKSSNQPLQIGDGTSKSFISALISMSTAGYSLPPVGYSFGSIILAQAATTIVDQGADEIRPGDIIALHGTDFKGKKGLTSYHITYGTTQEPAFACVIETTFESKKRKIRCVSVSSSSGGKSKNVGSPEEISLRLDDIKSGLLRVFRVPPKQGWLPE